MARHGRSYRGPHARNTKLARRNARIISATTRKRNPLTQVEAAAKFGVSQPTVSLVVRNVNATTVAA